MKKRAYILCWLLFFVCGCNNPSPPTTTVFCAASLTTLTTRLWSGPPDLLSLHTGGSHALVTQHLAGAEADLLLLADASLEKRLPRDGIAESRVFATNRLILAARRDSQIQASHLSDSNTVLALADPRSAPLGVYSVQALEETEVAARRVYLQDATAVLSALALAHADLAVVYASDLRHWPELREVENLDLSHHEPVRYLAVLLKEASPEARAFYQTLTSERGRAAIESAGLIPLTANKR